MGRPPKKNLPKDLERILTRVGSNIVYQRSLSKISQSELAKKSAISLSTLNEIETRHFRDIRISTLVAIARALSVPFEKLIHRTNLSVPDADQAQLLKASEAIFRIAKKLQKHDS